MSTFQTRSVLIVEPNEKLTHPYNSLPPTYHISRFSTIAEAVVFLDSTLPQLVMLSASFEVKDSVFFLEKLRQQVYRQLPHLIFVIDLSHPLSQVPGTTWGETACVLTSQSTTAMVDASLPQG